MKPHATAINQRLLRGQTPSYERLQARLAEDGSELNTAPIAVHCGWGRLLIGHTFPDPASLAQELLNEQPGERDIALYVAAPQQILGLEPTQLFLDPSDTLRLWFSEYRPIPRERVWASEKNRASRPSFIGRGAAQRPRRRRPRCGIDESSAEDSRRLADEPRFMPRGRGRSRSSTSVGAWRARGSFARSRARRGSQT